MNPSEGLRVLLLDEQSHPTALLRDELTRLGCEVLGLDGPTLVHDGVTRLRPDMVIVAARSPSRDTLEHLAVMQAHSPRPVPACGDGSDAALMRRALAAGVSVYVVDGLTLQRVQPVLQLALALFEQDARLRAELRHARDPLAARKRIERAKGVLMAQSDVDEPTAYARLRRMAMDEGLSLDDVAGRVITAREQPDGGH